MNSEQEICEWIIAHDAQNWSAEEISKAMLIEAVNNTVWAEDAYPGLKEKILNAIQQ